MSSGRDSRKKVFVWGLIFILGVVHYDFWYWSDTSVVFGFMPVGLFYHALISLLVGVCWALVVRYAWPDWIEEWAEEEDNRAFADKHRFPFPLICDTDREVGLAYHACMGPEDGYAERYSFLVDEDGRIDRVWTKVEPRSHAQQVLDHLDSRG